MARAECGGDCENIGSGGASAKAADIRLLYCRPVSHRVGKRHSQLDHIRTASDKRIKVGRRVSIACGDEGYKSGVWF
jgi:hypothetical protein